MARQVIKTVGDLTRELDKYANDIPVDIVLDPGTTPGYTVVDSKFTILVGVPKNGKRTRK